MKIKSKKRPYQDDDDKTDKQKDQHRRIDDGQPVNFDGLWEKAAIL